MKQSEEAASLTWKQRLYHAKKAALENNGQENQVPRTKNREAHTVIISISNRAR